MTLSYLILFLAIVILSGLILIRAYDAHADRSEWNRLSRRQPITPDRYDSVMVADLPEPARRFLNFAIMPGTPLHTVAEIRMGGMFSLGSNAKPGWQPMKARQILAAPAGFVWQLRLKGRVPVSGSDSGKWTRFRVFGLFPVARLGGDPDHALSAYGRCIAEAVFWSPAALLPGPGVRWEEAGRDVARVTVRHNGLSQTVDVTVNSRGQPVEISFQRWSNANPDRVFRFQPFGGVPSDFRDVQGFRLPFRVEAGNMFGTEAYFPFFKAEVSSVCFPTQVEPAG